MTTTERSIPLAVAAPETDDEHIRRIVAGVGEATGLSTADVGAARTMPPEAYTSETFFEFERRSVFDRSWLYLCHVSQIPEPGSVHSLQVGDEPLVVTRDRAGTIHVVSAVCQHRGYVMVDTDTESTGADSDQPTRILRCPYHAWSYGLDGRLLGAPSMSPAHDLDHLKATISLPKLRVEVWNGLVFANFDDDAAPLAPTLERLDAVVGPYRIDRLRVVHTMTLPDLPFNWKNMQENALEEYHTTYVHKGWHEHAPAHLVEHPDYVEGDGGVFRHAYLLGRADDPIEGFPAMPVMDGLPDDYYRRVLFMSVPPLNFGAVEAMGIKMFRITPQSAGRTTLTIQWLYPPETIERDDFDTLMEAQLGLVDAIDRPDLESNTGMFRGLTSRFAPRGPYSPYEATLPQFNHWLYERYAEGLDGV